MGDVKQTIVPLQGGTPGVASGPTKPAPAPEPAKKASAAVAEPVAAKGTPTPPAKPPAAAAGAPPSKEEPKKAAAPEPDEGGEPQAEEKPTEKAAAPKVDPEAKAKLDAYRKERLKLDEERKALQKQREEFEAQAKEHQKVIEALKNKRYLEAIHAAGGSIEDLNMEAMNGADPLVAQMRSKLEELDSQQRKFMEEYQTRQRQMAELEWNRAVMAVKSDLERAISSGAEERYELLAAEGQDYASELLDTYIEVGKRTGGRLPPLDEFLDAAENTLLERHTRFANSKKLKARLGVSDDTQQGAPEPSGKEAPKPQAVKGMSATGRKNGRMSEQEFMAAFQSRVFKP